GKALPQDVVRQQGGDVEAAVSTTGFTDAVIESLGRAPTSVPTAASRPRAKRLTPHPRWVAGEKRLAEVGPAMVLGVDIFVQSLLPPAEIGAKLAALSGPSFDLRMVSSRGVVVWPKAAPAFDHVGFFRARFISRDTTQSVSDEDLLALVTRVAGVAPWVHLEKLRSWGGEEGFTRAAGE
ncbi:MAG: hypothetical protein ACO3DB_04985, partial [Candidatus Limnocylindrus sp.]